MVHFLNFDHVNILVCNSKYRKRLILVYETVYINKMYYNMYYKQEKYANHFSDSLIIDVIYYNLNYYGIYVRY